MARQTFKVIFLVLVRLGHKENELVSDRLTKIIDKSFCTWHKNQLGLNYERVKLLFFSAASRGSHVWFLISINVALPRTRDFRGITQGHR